MKKKFDNKEQYVTLSRERLQKEKEAMLGRGTGLNKKFTNADIAHYLDYDEHYFARFLRKQNQEPITLTCARKLADLFGVRVEYLCGADDTRTEAEKIEIINDKFKSDIKNNLSALKDLGFEVHIVFNALSAKKTDEYYDFGRIEKQPTTEDLNMLLPLFSDTFFVADDINIITNKIMGDIQCADVVFVVGLNGVRKPMSIEQFSAFYENIKRTSHFIFNNFY